MDVCQGSGERPLIRVKVNVQLFKQAANCRILQKDEFGFANHDLLMAVAHVVGIVGPLPRGPWANDEYRLQSLFNGDNGPLGRQHHAVAPLQNRSVRE